MSDLKNAKEQYDAITIPEELSERVQEAIELSAEKHEQNKKVIEMTKRKKAARAGMGMAAAILAAFTVGLNTSTVFAEEMGKIPVIGAIAKVLTFESYEKQEDDLKISVSIPTVEMIAEDTKGLDDAVNQEILSLCQQYVDEAVKRAEEYRKAFLETGGTEEEWAAHNIEINVSYEIKSQTENYLSFVVRGSENWNAANNEERYYNLDLKNVKLVTLKELLGEDYQNIANESIKQQIKERENQGEVFFTPEEGGFTGITEEQKFYVNEAENPVIVFEKYEIAPGSSGTQEFEIKK